jgi:hypothetical protein
VNSSFPSRTHGTCIRLPLAPQTSPELAARVLADAALGCRLVLTQPPPSIVVKSMSAEATTFEVTFFTADVGLAQNAQTSVYENIFRALKVAGLALGSTNASASAAKIASDFVALPGLQRLLDSTGLFSHLDADERIRLADQLEREEFEPGEIVLSQASAVPALLIAGSGVLSVTRRSGERVDEITRLTAGAHFGADEIRKAVPSAASLTVIRRSTVYRLDKAAFLRSSGSDVATPAAVEAAE